MELQKALRLRIQQLCDVNELSLRGLCIRCGITYSTLQNVMGGRNRSITVETIHKICIGLDMELMAFFDSELFRNLLTQKV